MQRNLAAVLSVLLLVTAPPPALPKSWLWRSATGAPTGASELGIGPKTGIGGTGREVKLAREAAAHDDGADDGVEEEEDEDEEEEEDEASEAGSCRILSAGGSTALSGACR